MEPGSDSAAGVAAGSASDSGSESEWALELRGGTDAAMAPPVGYLQHVLLPSLVKHFGVRAQLKLLRRGFYPRGGGHAELHGTCLSPGACLPAVQLVEQGNLTSVTISAFTAGQCLFLQSGKA